MKKLFVLSIVVLALLLSCTEDELDEMSNGTITGIDTRECSCCGGYFININDSTYRFYNLPAGSEITLTNNQTFPVYVKLYWRMRDTLCLGDEIIVLKITKQ